MRDGCCYMNQQTMFFWEMMGGNFTRPWASRFYFKLELPSNSQLSSHSTSLLSPSSRAWESSQNLLLCMRPLSSHSLSAPLTIPALFICILLTLTSLSICTQAIDVVAASTLLDTLLYLKAQLSPSRSFASTQTRPFLAGL